MISEEVLKNAIDLLWGWMPAKEVNEIRRDEPELYQLCRDIHDEVWHDR